MRNLVPILVISIMVLTGSEISHAQVASSQTSPPAIPQWLLTALDAMRREHNGLSGQVHGDPPLCGVNSENTMCCDTLLQHRHDAIEGIAQIARDGAFSGMVPYVRH